MMKKNTTTQVQGNKFKGVIKRLLVPAIIVISLFIILTEDNLTEMSTLKSAFLIFVGFITVCTCIYCGTLTFFSLISGWRVLSIRLSVPETVLSDSAIFSSQSVKMGYMDYSMSVNIRFTETGMIFSQSRFFAFMHKPFFIPYEKIGDCTEMDSSGSNFDSDFEFVVEGVKIRMSGESAEAMNKKKMNPALPVVLLKNSNDDYDENSLKRGEQRIITKKCRFEELQTAFISEVSDFIKSKKAGKLNDKILYCYETIYMEKGFLGIVYHQYTDLLITPEWFFWGVIDGDGSSAGCVKIKDIAKTLNSEKILVSNPLEISGINISGFHYDESQLNTWSIKVGNDEAGESFRKELVEAIKQYRK